jgi:uncharacterized protein
MFRKFHWAGIPFEMKKKLLRLGICSFGLFLSGQAAAGPSFNCNSGRLSLDEFTICSSPRLASLDQQLTMVWRSLDSFTRDRAKLDQRAWLARRAGCGANALCIEQLYQNRITQLNALVGAASPVPAAPVPAAPRPPSAPPFPTSNPGGGGDACELYPDMCR